MLTCLFFLFLTPLIHCGGMKRDERGEGGKMLEKLMGVDTVHVEKKSPEKLKIDKDTIITRNLKLEKKGSSKQNKALDERDPDWSYSAIPQAVSMHVAQFKLNMTECLKEVQAADTRPVKRLSPKTESPIHGECLIACVLKRNHVIHNGKVNKDVIQFTRFVNIVTYNDLGSFATKTIVTWLKSRENLLALVSKFFAKDTKIMKKLENNVDQCIAMSARHTNDCDLAARLNECTNGIMHNNKHKVVVNY